MGDGEGRSRPSLLPPSHLLCLPVLAHDSPQKEEERCIDFLRNYRTPSVRKGAPGDPKYLTMADHVAQRQLTKLTIALDDVQLVDPGLAVNIEKNAFRYGKLFADAFDKLLPPPSRDIVTEDVFDVIQAHRMRQLTAAAQAPDADAAAAGADPDEAAKALIEKNFPPALFRRFEVRFAPRSEAKAGSLRNVVATDLGKLVTVKCIVVRASDIKPICVVATYTCDQCGYELYQEVRARRRGYCCPGATPPLPPAAAQVTGKTFMPLPRCNTEQCSRNKSQGRLQMQVGASAG